MTMASGEVRSQALQVPPVTVLMGVFNGRPLLERAVRSIIDQTFKDFEFLIIDDGSVDGSADVIRQYAAADPRIRVLINPRNRGLGAVLNQGVAEARGELVARMDADDLSMPYRLERQLEFFRDHPRTDVVGSYALDVDAQGKVVRKRYVPLDHQRIVDLIWSCPLIHATVMFRRQAILDAGSYSPALRRRQDYDLWFRCARAGLRFANIPEPLVHYHFSSDTLKRSNFRATLQQVRVGLRGCRLVRAPLPAYAATMFPLLEAALPQSIRRRLVLVKSRFDPRAAGQAE